MKTASMDRVRRAVEAICQDDDARVGTIQLCEALGFDNIKERARVRRQLTEMCDRGELIRVEPGMYRRNPKPPTEPTDSLARVWRAIRVQRPGFTMGYLAQVTRVSYTQTLKYCRWLRDEGFIRPCGKDGLKNLFECTSKATKHPETPRPPKPIRDPFMKERAAAARIVRSLLLLDPYAERTRRMIHEDCRVLLERFGETAESTTTTDAEQASRKEA